PAAPPPPSISISSLVQRLPLSKLEAVLARAGRERLDTAVKSAAVPIEADPLHPRRLGALRGGRADRGRRLLVPRVLSDRLADRWFEGGCGRQGPARGVVDDLAVDVLAASEDGEAGPLGGTRNPPANRALPPRPSLRLVPVRFHGSPPAFRT